MPFGLCLLGHAFWVMPFGPCLLGHAFWAMPFGPCLLGNAFWAMPFGPCLLGHAFWAMPFGPCLLGHAFWAMPFGLCLLGHVQCLRHVSEGDSLRAKKNSESRGKHGQGLHRWHRDCYRNCRGSHGPLARGLWKLAWSWLQDPGSQVWLHEFEIKYSSRKVSAEGSCETTWVKYCSKHIKWSQGTWQVDYDVRWITSSTLDDGTRCRSRYCGSDKLGATFQMRLASHVISEREGC